MSVSPENGGDVEVDGILPDRYPSDASFGSNTPVGLEAFPAQGYRFDHWAGDLTGSVNPTTIIMTCDKGVTAFFTKMNYDLTVNVSPSQGGGVRVNGALPPAYPGVYSFSAAATVSLEAVAAAGYYFEGWSGGLTGSQNPATVTMNASKTVTADFLPLIHENISAAEALDMIQRGGVVLLDVREEGEYCAGHVPGALNYPWNSGVLDARYDELSKTTPLLTLCRTGVRSHAAAAFLSSVGFRQVYDVLGGMVAWEGETEACGDIRPVYFTHVETRGPWETDLFVVNFSGETLNGSIVGYDGDGEFVSQIDLDLPPSGRRKIAVGDPGEGFDQADKIRCAVLYTSVEAVSAFEKVYVEGRYSAAVSAVVAPEMNGETIHIPHIASDSNWVTGVALVNTTMDPKSLSFRFSDGSEKTLSMNPLEHKAFRIRDLFSGSAQPGISGADVGGAGGVIGMALFVKEKANLLSGVLLKDDLAATLLYPHVPMSLGWETGIVARNTATAPVTLEIHPFSESGETLPVLTRTVEAGGRFFGPASSLGLPEDTAWLRLVTEYPILTGLELFTRGEAMAGFESVHIDRRSGVFPNIDSSSVAGIAVVNLEEEPASVTFTACNDDGGIVAEKTVALGGYSRLVNYPSAVLGADLTGATFIRYESDRSLAGFQLNASRDGRMLDGLSGM